MSGSCPATLMPYYSPKVSVIIPTFNRAGSILPALESVRCQTFENLEIIIVDDASEDATASLLESLDDPRIRTIRHDQNRGAAAARNTGTRSALGPFIAFQDSDDLWEPDKLALQLAELERKKDARVCYGTLVRTWDGKTTVTPKQSIVSKEGDLSEEILFHNVVGTPTMLLEKQAIIAVDGFDETLPCLEDWEINIRLAQQFRYAFVKQRCVKAEVQKNSISRNLDAVSIALDRIHGRHLELFRQNCRANAKFLARRGHYRAINGDLSAGRSFFLSSLQEFPFYVPAVALFVLSWLGIEAYQRVAQLKTPLP